MVNNIRVRLSILTIEKSHSIRLLLHLCYDEEWRELQGNKRKIEYRNGKAVSRATCKKKEQAKQCRLTVPIPYIPIPTSDWQGNKIKIESDNETKAVGTVSTQVRHFWQYFTLAHLFGIFFNTGYRVGLTVECLSLQLSVLNNYQTFQINFYIVV